MTRQEERSKIPGSFSSNRLSVRAFARGREPCISRNTGGINLKSVCDQNSCTVKNTLVPARGHAEENTTESGRDGTLLYPRQYQRFQ
ncbi:unnamed protein product [Calicophoron daubneyi]|uniref:Uncharacterized protein n=1 Tax=Calicophoron daubneyi TaxID=300641 RepID=A0AAV2THS6_CALDB